MIGKKYADDWRAIVGMLGNLYFSSRSRSPYQLREPCADDGFYLHRQFCQFLARHILGLDRRVHQHVDMLPLGDGKLMMWIAHEALQLLYTFCMPGKNLRKI